MVLFAEGGGGRPGDVDWPIVAGLDVRAFELFARLSGLVPLVGIAAGYCFAGNAALLGCCDVVIATEDSNIGMGGPAMIEGGGLGVHDPRDIGPIEVQRANGVVDLRVADEAAAVDAAKRYLAYFDRAPRAFEAPDPRRAARPRPRGAQARLRRPHGHRRAGDDGTSRAARRLRRGDRHRAGPDRGTLARHRRQRPAHLGGAIDAAAADKAARFLQLCDAFDLPVLFLCDTPGFMVGPEAEKTATVRHVARLFVTGANLTVPDRDDRPAQGLRARRPGDGRRLVQGHAVHGRLADVGVRRHGPGGRGQLGLRKELDAIADSEERERAYAAVVNAAYEHGKGLNMAAYGEIDDVIDPADSRRWIATLFDDRDWRSRQTKKRPYIDTW